jgi:hypothetical protein
MIKINVAFQPRHRVSQTKHYIEIVNHLITPHPDVQVEISDTLEHPNLAINSNTGAVTNILLHVQVTYQQTLASLIALIDLQQVAKVFD